MTVAGIGREGTPKALTCCDAARVQKKQNAEAREVEADDDLTGQKENTEDQTRNATHSVSKVEPRCEMGGGGGPHLRAARRAPRTAYGAAPGVLRDTVTPVLRLVVLTTQDVIMAMAGMRG